MSKAAPKNRFLAPAKWSAHYLTQSPIFADLCQRFPLARLATWPNLTELNAWQGGAQVHFVDNECLTRDGRYYEDFIYATKQVPTRLANWHDLFGALIWCLFPKTKAVINQLHVTQMAIHGQKTRSPLRHKLTLLDECGLIIAFEPQAAEHVDWLRQHQWQQSFWQHRADWQQTLRPVIFGHALYEMATQPFIGLTAKSWFLPVPAGFSQWALTDAYTFLDEMLSQQIANSQLLLNNEQLTPLPLLGVPGWYPANTAEDFYRNTAYFRPRRQLT